jgi:hypothetical protein
MGECGHVVTRPTLDPSHVLGPLDGKSQEREWAAQFLSPCALEHCLVTSMGQQQQPAMAAAAAASYGRCTASSGLLRRLQDRITGSGCSCPGEIGWQRRLEIVKAVMAHPVVSYLSSGREGSKQTVAFKKVCNTLNPSHLFHRQLRWEQVKFKDAEDKEEAISTQRSNGSSSGRMEEES